LFQNWTFFDAHIKLIIYKYDYFLKKDFQNEIFMEEECSLKEMTY
jgi:hypothetical protein